MIKKEAQVKFEVTFEGNVPDEAEFARILSAHLGHFTFEGLKAGIEGCLSLQNKGTFTLKLLETEVKNGN